MAVVRIPTSSMEFLHVPITSTNTLGGYPVEMAVLPYGTNPQSSDWKTAEWDGNDAKILIGPGSGTIGQLTAGNYIAWVRITTGEEKPVIEATAVVQIY